MGELRVEPRRAQWSVRPRTRPDRIRRNRLLVSVRESPRLGTDVAGIHPLHLPRHPARPVQVAHFAPRGLTHVDLSLSFDLRPGPLTLHHESHAQWSVDDATRRTSADPADDRRVKFWFELSASWTPRVLKW